MSDMALDRSMDPTQLALERASVPSSLPQSGAAPPAPKSSPADDLMRQFAASQRRTEGIVEQEEREKGPVIDAALAANRQPGPQPPRLERESEAPKSNIQQQMQEWMMPMVALSALAGAFSRQHATTALNAFAAGMQGFKEGNLTLFDQKLKEWKAANEKVLSNNKAAMDEYNAVWNNRKLNIDQKMNEIQLISAKYQDRLTYEAASQKNFTLVAQMLQKQEHLQDQLNLQYENLKVKTEALDEKMKAAASRMESTDPFVLQQRLDAIQDPEQKKRVMNMIKTLHPNGALFAGGEGPYSEQTLKEMVDRRLAGDKTAATGLGRSQQAMAAFNEALSAEMDRRNMSGADLAKIDQQYAGGTAYQRTAGGQAARVEVSSNEVEQALPQALEASKKLPRGNIVPLNKLIQSYEQGTSNEAYNDFITANFALINSYTRAMNPQGIPRITERLEQHAIGLLSTATSPQAYEVQARRLWKEVQGSKMAVAKTREGVTGGDINAPVPGLDTGGARGGAGAAPSGASGLSDDDLKKKLGL